MNSASNLKSQFLVLNSICILSFEDIAIEYRVRNQVKALSEQFEIELIGVGDWQPPKNVLFKKLPKSHKRFLFYSKYLCILLIGKIFPPFYKYFFNLKSEYKEADKIIRANNYPFIHANDWDGLYIAVTASSNNRGKVIFDAHEYSEEQESEKMIWRLLVRPFRRWVFKKCLPKVSGMVTVSKPIAELFANQYSIKNVQVVRNSRYYLENEFRPSAGDRIRIVYHGAALRTRHLEDFFTLAESLDERFSIDLMLVDVDRKYLSRLRKKNTKIDNPKIRILDSVDYSHLQEILKKYDIGIPALSSPNINHQYALGGKFFDYVTAGLAIATPPLPAYKQLVMDYELGVIAQTMSIKSLACGLNQLSVSKLNEYKKNSINAAPELSFDYEKNKLLDIYEQFLS